MNTIYRQKLDRDDGQRTEILIGQRLLGSSEAREHLGTWLEDRTLFVLSTPRVTELHGAALEDLCAGAKRRVDLEVEDGEGAKSVAQAARLWQEMLEQGGKRDSRLLAFGGGCVTDLGGFVAGCFLRGIDFVQVPSTLLAQVDAAIGGKTGVDLPDGKNTVGLFRHPHAVLSDTTLLTTLPRGELRSGLVEVVKMAALLDVDLLGEVELRLEKLLAGDAEALGPVVSAASAAKCRVVEEDFREGGRRRLLNFGHTLGHAIEGALGYEGLSHGDAVAYGLLFVCRLARRRGLGGPVQERLVPLLDRFGLPPLPELDPATLWEFMTRDKKATESGIAWVLPVDLGHGETFRDVGRAEVMAEIEAFLSDPWDEKSKTF